MESFLAQTVSNVDFVVGCTKVPPHRTKSAKIMPKTLIKNGKKMLMRVGFEPTPFLTAEDV